MRFEEENILCKGKGKRKDNARRNFSERSWESTYTPIHEY